jgi:glycosyltransferase involved in cell wall biosynthesis
VRIAFDSQIFALQRFGGISRYIVRLAEQLAASEHAVKVVAPFHQNSHLEQAQADLVSGKSVAPALRRATKFLLPINHFVGARAIAAFKPDIVHETYYAAQASSRAAPCVVTVHDMIHERYPEQFRAFGSTSNRKRAAVKRADHVICISHSTQRDLQHFFDVPAEKISVVHHGYEQFQSQGAAVTREGNRPLILYVGLRGGYKNFAALVGAFASSARLRADFDLVAFGGGAFSNDEQLALRAAGLRPEQARQVSGADSVLGGLYKQAAAFVYCSKYEGFGLPPLEAMAQGVPVVSSKTSSMPEVIGDAAEFFDPESSEDLAGALERVVYSSARAAALVTLGEQRLTQFSWRRCALETAASYARLMK